MAELHLHVPDDVKTEIAARAAQEGRSMSSVIIGLWRGQNDEDEATQFVYAVSGEMLAEMDRWEESHDGKR